MPKKLPIWDQRMFVLMQFCIDNNIAGIKTQGDFMAKLDISATGTIKQIREGAQSFRHHQMKKACDITGASMDWIYGFTDRMHRLEAKLNPLDQLKEATRVIEIELKKKAPITKVLTAGTKGKIKR